MALRHDVLSQWWRLLLDSRHSFYLQWHWGMTCCLNAEGSYSNRGIRLNSMALRHDVVSQCWRVLLESRHSFNLSGTEAWRAVSMLSACWEENTASFQLCFLPKRFPDWKFVCIYGASNAYFTLFDLTIAVFGVQ
jgi:hypothetical protein